MEQQPDFEPRPAQPSRVRRFGGRLGRVLLYSALGSALYALVVGPRSIYGFADGLFIAGMVLLVIALFPLIAEILGRSTLPLRVGDRSPQEALAEEQGRARENEVDTYLFGTGGVIVVALSFVITFIA